MWVLSMINLPTVVYAFLYTISWSEVWDFFPHKLPAFQLQAQEDSSQGFVWSRHGRAALSPCVMDPLGLLWPWVCLWHFMSAQLGAKTPRTAPAFTSPPPPWRLHFLSGDASSSAKFEQESRQAPVEIQEVAPEGSSKMEESLCERDKDY